MSDIKSYRIEIEKKLESTDRKRKLASFLAEILKGITYFIIPLFLFLLAEWGGAFQPPVRTVLFFILMVLLIIILVKYVVLPLFPFFRRTDYFETAGFVGGNFPEIKDELKNSLQINAEKGEGFSEELVEAAFKRVYNIVKGYNFKESVNFAPVLGNLKKTFSALSVLIVLPLLFSGLRDAGFRLWNYDREFTAPPEFSFIVEPGNAEITKGSDFNITIRAKGNAPSVIDLKTRFREDAVFSGKRIIADSTGSFHFRIKAASGSFRYFAEAGAVRSEEYFVNVIDRPVIKTFELSVIPPSYSGLPVSDQKDNGNINALPGSLVKINLKSTKLLSSAQLIFSESGERGMESEGFAASAKFKISGEENYHLSISDTAGNKNEDPVSYEINVLKDAFPFIELISPDKDLKLSGIHQVSLLTKISDDYGFSKLLLKYRLSSSDFSPVQEEFNSVAIPFNKKVVEDNIYYVWDLTDMFLATDDVVSYYLEVFDNDNVSGPKSSRTGILTLRVPSLDELFTNAEDVQESAQDELMKTLEEAVELKEEMEKISDEMKQDNREITWEEKEKIEKTMEKFQGLEDKVSEVSEKVSEMQKELQQNDLLSQETLEKYMELQELMDQLSSEEMKKAMEELQNKLQQMMRQQVQESFEDMQLDEENFKKSLERTINLLKRIQIEQKMDEMMKRTEELSEQLNEMQKEMENMNGENPQENDAAQKKQEEAGERLKQLEKTMQELAEKMSEFEDMPNSQMQDMMEEFDKQGNQELSEQAQQQMQQGDMQQAQQMQQQMSENMDQMMQMMQSLQKQMQQQNQMQTFSEMYKSLDDLLSLSKEQENLKNQSKEMERDSQQFRENARKQSELQSNLDKLLQQMSELSQKTFAISPEMGEELGKARSEMNKAMEQMQNMNSPMAAMNQEEAMMAMNSAAAMMQGAMQQMMQGGSGGSGMMSMMQQLQQMGQQQMSLNQMTKMMQNGQMTQQQMAQLQRLAQEQQMIQKSLEQLNKEAKQSGSSKKLASNLDDIIREMKEVVIDMQTEKLNDDLVQKQERILSKLLDAQRSINERDFEKKRESIAGKNYKQDSPPELLLDTEEGRNQLREELMKAVREGYSRDYEELIRRYFNELEKQKTGEGN